MIVPDLTCLGMCAAPNLEWVDSMSPHSTSRRNYCPHLHLQCWRVLACHNKKIENHDCFSSHEISGPLLSGNKNQTFHIKHMQYRNPTCLIVGQFVRFYLITFITSTAEDRYLRRKLRERNKKELPGSESQLTAHLLFTGKMSQPYYIIYRIH